MDNGSAGRGKDQTHTKPAAPIEGDVEQKRNLAYLVVLAGVSAGEMFKLQLDKTVIGRGPRCAVRLNDEGVSREHCQLVREVGAGAGAGETSEPGTDKIVLEDLGSTNGTFCNGERVDRRDLTDGDKISVGASTILKFTYQDQVDERYQKRLFESALRDGLTRAFNRRYFVQRLAAEVRFAERHEQPLALLMLDLDHFKQLNDSWGHIVGDGVLRALVDVLHDTLRAEDVLARYGGEEFTVLARGINADNARALAERVRRVVEGMKLSKDGAPLPVTVSIGISVFPLEAAGDEAGGAAPDEASTSEQIGRQLIERADAALYRAKRAGRNRVES